ncbi:hypothetical protein [Janibacter sp. GXQ6167]|uniref:hypothetical protein n=1 Tax=Janibacter sp. GXQ6167 TaxID=3240791 RepID=UPI0035249B9D
MRAPSAVAGAALAGIVAGAGMTFARRIHAGPWRRTNFAGRPVTLLEGPVFVAATALPAIWRRDLPAVLAIVGPGVMGGVDDLAGDATAKGLGGHLRALRSGRITTGSAKIAVIGASALAAVLLERHAATTRPPLVWLVVDTGVVAGAANLINLLDLRPGRALKAAGGTATLLLAEPTSRAVSGPLLGATAALLPADLGAEGMLGDCGANAAGSQIGLALTRACPPWGRAAILAGIVALTLISERVSFTKVIENTPVLRELDAWGRTSP